MVADDGGCGRAGYWDHVNVPVSIARGERRHRSHDRQRTGRESGITGTRGLRLGVATATQWRHEATDGGGTERLVVGNTPMCGRRRVAPMGQCRSSGSGFSATRFHCPTMMDDRWQEVPRDEQGRG